MTDDATDRRDRSADIVRQALELSATERSAFIDEACDGDSTLRDEVASLLAALDRAGSFMQAPTIGEATRLAAADATDGPGSRIGRYKLLQVIGEGGFGVVYMAEQEKPVRRKVALKIIKLGMDTKQVIARFEAERQALALMDHPNIARVLDAGATESGRPFFVMELVRGVSITEYCDTHNLPTRERLELFTEVCHAIQHAHQKGVIHRDIKPSNVLVTMHDGHPVPKVIDFGIAKATDHRLTEKTLFTEFRQFVGTPEYMSPEQAEMSGLDIDTRTDVYALGVLLYELLTGTTPFDRKSLAAAGYGEIQRIIREQEPPKPSTRLSTLGEGLDEIARSRRAEPRGLCRLLRGDLDWIVMKAMEKDRTRRYDTANGLAMDVGRYLQDEPVLASPPTTGYRLRKFVHRNRPLVIGGSVVAAALLVGFTVATVALVRMIDAESKVADARDMTVLEREKSRLLRQAIGSGLSLAVLPLRNLGDDPGQEYFAAGLTDELITDLESVRTVRVSSSPSVARYRDSTRPVSEIAGELGVDLVLEGSVLRVGHDVEISVQLVIAASDLPLWASTYVGDARDVLALRKRIFRDVAEEIQLELTPEERSRLSRARPVDSEAHEAYLKGRFALHSATEEDARRAIEHFDEAIAEDPDYAMAYVGKSHAYRLLEEAYRAPREVAPPAMEAARQALRIDPDLAEAHVELGIMTLSYEWDWEEARAHLERAIELNPNIAMAHLGITRYYTVKGRCEEVLEALRRARSLDPVTTLVLDDASAQAPYMCRDFDLAIAGAEAAIALDATYYSPYSWKGLALSALGRHDEAIVALEQAWELSGSDPTKRSPVVAEFLGGVYALAGRTDDAEAMLIELDRQAAVERRYVCPYEVATIYVALGAYFSEHEMERPIRAPDGELESWQACVDRAFAWFNRAIDERSGCVPWLPCDVRLDPIRDDPRFTALLVRAGHDLPSDR